MGLWLIASLEAYPSSQIFCGSDTAAQNYILSKRIEKTLSNHRYTVKGLRLKEKNNQLESEAHNYALKIQAYINCHNSQIIKISRIFELAKKLPLIFQSSNIEEK